MTDELTKQIEEMLEDYDPQLRNALRVAIEFGLSLAESELYSEEQCIESYCSGCEFHNRGDCPRLLECNCNEIDDFLSALKSLKQ